MSPFLLEPTKYNPNVDRVKNMLYHKKTFSPGVKIEGWQGFQGSLPTDNNPLDPAVGVNLHLSHYKRLGTYPDDSWATTTEEALRKTQSRRHELERINPHKMLVNLYTSIDENCQSKQSVCPCSQDYVTTMQHSYQPPYPKKLQRLSMPKIPFYLNRKMKSESECPFRDDDYRYQIGRLQAHKKIRHVSYNPMTGCYTDGRRGTWDQPKCVELNYD